MILRLGFVILLLFISGNFYLWVAADGFWGRGRCTRALQTWATDSLEKLSSSRDEDFRVLKELLFFLHIPRTGGRTYHQCLLRHLYPPDKLCDGSYDKLRFNFTEHCRLLATHDDYSVSAKLPVNSTSVITIMRHPVDRIFSAYEFSIEVASRFFGGSPGRKSGGATNKNLGTTKTIKNRGANTLDIWPWSYLVPWMRDDLRSRRVGRGHMKLVPPVHDIDNYNASTFAMPLHEFIEQPMVMDLLHNGATYQVAGLTNNSFNKWSTYLRRCVINYADLGNYVLDVAKRKMDLMLFVGLTDKHKDTSTLFAHVVGGQLFPVGMSSNSSIRTGISTRSEQHHSKAGAPFQQRSSHQNFTVYSLIETYNTCADQLRGTQVRRRILSLKSALPVNFSNEARLQVHETTFESIQKRNRLDLELYAYAQLLFARIQDEASKSGNIQKNNLHFTFGELPVSRRLHSLYLVPSVNSRKLMLVMIFLCGGAFALGARVISLQARNRLMKFHISRKHGKK